MTGFRPPKPEPKPGGLPFWKVLPTWLRDGLAVLSDKAYRMKMGQFRFPTRRFFMLNDPPLIRQVLVERAHDFPKSDILGCMLKRLMGDSIFTSNGAVWRRQRAMLNPAFEATRVRLVFDQMRFATDRMIERLDTIADGAPQDIDIETTHVTADIILRTIFSETLDRERAERVFTAFNRFQEIAYRLGMWRVFRVPTFIFFARNREADRMAREIKGLLATEIARIMDPVARPLPLYPTKPQVVLVVGVNGSGKTTTIGKLASQFKAAGKSVVIAAGDTFRAAAVEQLQVWGDRAGVPVLTAPEGSDPASLAFDAMTKAQADGADLLMIDTAGRLQNRADLMEELAKIVRVIRKKDETAPHNTLLVLDATTGQNALNQVDIFRKISDVSGLVMTKLDGTAKGGVLVALADKFGLPIHAIGVGEQIDDLAPFDPEEFAAALTGLDTPNAA